MMKIRISKMACAKLRDAAAGAWIALPDRELQRKITDAIAEPSHHRFAVTDVEHPDDVTILHELTFEVRLESDDSVRAVPLNAVQRDGAIITMLAHNVVRNNLLGGRWIPCDMPADGSGKRAKKPPEPKVDTAPPLPPPELAIAIAGTAGAPPVEVDGWKVKPIYGVTPELIEVPIEVTPTAAAYVTPLGAIARAEAAAAESRQRIATHEMLGAEVVDAEFELAASVEDVARASARYERAQKRRDLARDALVEAAQRAAKEPTA